MNITKNFTLEEMIKTNKPFKNIPSKVQLACLYNLVISFLQPLRDKLGKPIKIINAFRCKEVNNASGGTAKSQHLSGQACDIAVEGMTKYLLFMFIIANMKFDQLILEVDSNCLHVSFVSEQQNRNQILVRKIVNGEKEYFQYTKETVKKFRLA